MSGSSNAAALEMPAVEGHGLRSVLTWIWRFLVCLLVMATWLGITVSAAAYVLPPALDPYNGSLRDGVFCSFPINIYLGLLTAAYYTTILPTLLLPVRDEERFIWFLHIAFGWMVSLLGTTALLALFDQLVVHSLSTPFNWRGLSLILGGGFLVPMALSLALAVDGRRRLACLVALLVGWVIAQGGVIAYVAFLLSLRLDPETIEKGMGVEKLAFLFSSGLYVIFVTSLTLPGSRRMRGELLAFLLLLWCFALAGLLCFHVMQGRIELAGALAHPDLGPFRRRLWFRLDPTGSATPAALVQFGGLVLTVWLAPFLGWLGMPWARRERGRWTICLALAALVILRVVQDTPFSEKQPLLVHVLTSYDGTHLLPAEFAR